MISQASTVRVRLRSHALTMWLPFWDFCASTHNTVSDSEDFTSKGRCTLSDQSDERWSIRAMNLRIGGLLSSASNVVPILARTLPYYFFQITMMHARDIVAAIELAVYIPAAILAVTICVRHGFNRSSGWIYTLILCIVRIAGAVCQFLSRQDHSNGLIEARIIIDSIGLSPLLLATLGLLSRL